MKQLIKIFILSVLVLSLAGCGDTGAGARGIAGGTSVDQVVNDQMSAADGENSDAQAASPSAAPGVQTIVTADQFSAPADYDLTAMNSDMVYATVYQMMYEPDDYVGKTIRMNGLYYASFYEPTGKYYHCCLIQDALACCAQGMEFVWDDGSHVYPDEYPAENTEIVVQGTFDLYQEEGDELLYCRLKDASVEVAGKG